MSDQARTLIAQKAQQIQKPATSGLLQRQCACGNHTVAGGECATCAKQKGGLQRKLAIGASNDPLEREADRVADTIVHSGRAIQPVTASATKLPVQRQPDDTQKPREQPTTFPVEEQPKQGKEKEDEEQEKLKTGALKAAGELAKLLWDGFSTSQIGTQILAQNERDWKPAIKFFEDFAATWAGKIVLGAAAGGAATGAFLGARSAREENVLPDPSSDSPAKLLVPKDEKFVALELNWDFISPPTGVTIKTPWLDLPKIGGGPTNSASTTLPPAPKLVKPMQKIPRICTPADPRGDHGEADARSAQIYSWLLWKQQQEADKMKELLRKYTQPIQAPGKIWRPGQPYSFRQSQLSAIKPLFKRTDGAPEVTDPQAIEAGLQSAAHPLDPTIRAEMEMRFGHDFSRVRVHADQAADRSARSVNALAYTVGSDVVFGSGRYAPATSAGRRLLAHELTHVVQQDRTTGRALGPPGAEHEASQAAARVTRGDLAHVRGAVPRSIQRAPNGGAGPTVNFPDPSTLTYDKLGTKVGEIMRYLQSAAMNSPEREDVESNILPRYIETMQRLSKRLGYGPVVIMGLDPLNPVHQKVLQLLGQQAQAPSPFLFPPAPKATASAPSTDAQKKAAQDFIRTQMFPLTWQVDFLQGVQSSPLRAAMIEAYGQGKQDLGSWILSASYWQFTAGMTVGIPIGAVTDLYNIVKGIAEAILLAYLTNLKVRMDPQGFKRELEAFARNLANQLTQAALNPTDIGKFAGQLAASKFKGWSTTPTPFGRGRFLGEIVGMLAMEIALLFIGPEEVVVLVSDVAKAARTSALGEGIARALSASSKEFKAIMSARGLAAEARAAEAGGTASKRLIPGLTQAEVDAAIEGATTPGVTGRAKPRIDDRAVPTRQLRRLDAADLIRRPGETEAQAIERVRSVIGKRITETPLTSAWQRARSRVLGNRSIQQVTREEMLRKGGLYDQARNAFWEEVQADANARRFLNNADLDFAAGRAPMLRVNTADVPTQELRVSLDHVNEKAIGDNWQRAIDADNLAFEFQNPNSFREIVQMRHPELRGAAASRIRIATEPRVRIAVEPQIRVAPDVGANSKFRIAEQGKPEPAIRLSDEQIRDQAALEELEAEFERAANRQKGRR